MSNIVEEDPRMRVTGSMLSWDDEKGVGFVEAAIGGRHIFMHIDDVVGQKNSFSVGQKISYIQSTDKQGRACASSILQHGDSPKKVHSNKRGVLNFALALIALLGGGIAVWLNTFDGNVTFEVWVIEVKRWLSGLFM